MIESFRCWLEDDFANLGVGPLVAASYKPKAKKAKPLANMAGNQPPIDNRPKRLNIGASVVKDLGMNSGGSSGYYG
jgi:hypothetical protein